MSRRICEEFIRDSFEKSLAYDVPMSDELRMDYDFMNLSPKKLAQLEFRLSLTPNPLAARYIAWMHDALGTDAPNPLSGWLKEMEADIQERYRAKTPIGFFGMPNGRFSRWSGFTHRLCLGGSKNLAPYCHWTSWPMAAPWLAYAGARVGGAAGRTTAAPASLGDCLKHYRARLFTGIGLALPDAFRTRLRATQIQHRHGRNGAPARTGIGGESGNCRSPVASEDVVRQCLRQRQHVPLPPAASVARSGEPEVWPLSR